MSTSEGVAEKIAKLGFHKVLIPTPYVPYHNNNNDPIPDVRHEYVVCFPLDGSGPHLPEASHWNLVRRVVNMPREQPTFWAFLLLMLYMDTPAVGTRRPIFNRTTHRATYDRCVLYAAQQKRGKTLKATESQWLLRATQADRNVDLYYMAAIDQKVITLERQEAQQRQQQQAGAPAAAAARMPPPDLPSPIPVGWINVLPQMDPQLTFLVNSGIPEYRVDMVMIPEPQMRITIDAIYRGIQIMTAEQPAPAPQAADVVVPEEELAWEPDRVDIVPKVRMTVSALPYANDQSKVACVLVRFLVSCPEWNPGVFFKSLFDNVERRRQNLLKNSGSGDARSANQELFINYARLFHSQHPVGNDLKWQDYVQMVQAMLPNDAAIKTPSIVAKICDLCSDFTSNYHLRNLFSLSKALETARNCGAFCGNSNDWWNEHEARFPIISNTFKYMPETFWFHDQYPQGK
jgi:hypothetical protein